MEHVDPSTFTAAQRRTWHELLAADTPRPAVDPDAAERCRADLLARTAAAAALVPPGDRGLWVSKHRLDTLDCDGRFLDDLAAAFSWSPHLVVGQLAHRAIEIDLAGRRRRGADEIVRRAWTELAAGPGHGAEAMAALAPVEVDDLCARALARMLEFRESFPLLPPEWVRAEVSCKAHLHGRRITLVGRPDLVIGRTHPHRRKMLLVDLKTGSRHPRHREDMRFYALLALLKYRVAPFRVATYYLDEADWEVEDVDDDLLGAAVAAVGDKVERAARLRYDPPEPADLRLVPGPACGWCSRAPSCPANLARAEGLAPAAAD